MYKKKEEKRNREERIRGFAKSGWKMEQGGGKRSFFPLQIKTYIKINTNIHT